MKLARPSICLLPIWLAILLLAGPIDLHSEGPLFVGGPPRPGLPSVPGKPFIWTINPLTYWTDQGALATTLPKSDADNLVQQAFQAWQDVPTASISFNKAGDLPQDVTAGNILTVLSQLYDCGTTLTSSSLARARTIIYDTDGSAIRAMGDDPTMVLGVSSPACFASDGINNYFQRGFMILNGKPVSSGQHSLAELQSTMIHEFGHLIGLDHSQVNLNCLTGACMADDLTGVPIMFPVAVVGERTTLSTDDVAGVSALYPEAVNAPPGQVAFSTLGRIQGRVVFSDGVTPAQGFNVIARQVDDPSTPTVNESRKVAASNVSGFLFTACVGVPDTVIPPPNNNCGTDPSTSGSRDESLISFFDIPGLPLDSGQQYTLEVEAIHDSSPNPFIGSSSVGPIGAIGFQFRLLTPCSPLFLWSPTASCTDKAELQPVAGQVLNTGTDIVLTGTTGTLPRYDVWEDGP